MNIHEAEEIVKAWWIEYNTYGPHSSLNYLTLSEFARRCEVAAEQSARALVAVNQRRFPLTCRRYIKGGSSELPWHVVVGLWN